MPICAALAGAANDCGAVDPKLGAAAAPDAAGAEGAGVPIFPSENPTEARVMILSIRKSSLYSRHKRSRDDLMQANKFGGGWELAWHSWRSCAKRARLWAEMQRQLQSWQLMRQSY